MNPPPIVICTNRIENWDIELCVQSCEYYAPEHQIYVCSTIDGGGYHKSTQFLQAPEDCDTFGSIFNFALSGITDPSVIILNDDTTLHPDTMGRLLHDVSVVKNPGMVGTLSNYISGAQNIRRSPAVLPIEAPRLSPVCAWIDMQAFRQVGGFPPINWYSDDAICHDMRRAGWKLYISSAYVNHIGQRSTGGISKDNNRRLTEEGISWMVDNRPDLVNALGIRRIGAVT